MDQQTATALQNFNTQANISTTQLQAELSSKRALEEAQKDRDFNANEAQKSRDFYLDMWNATNDYNSSTSQMERLQQAGVNPAMAFGNNYTSSVASASPTGIASTSSGGSLAGSLVNAPASLLSAQANYINAQTNARATNYQVDWNIMTEEQRIAELDSNVSKNYADIQKILASAGLDNVNIEQVKENLKWLSLLNAEELKQKKQILTNLFNENIETLQNIKESASRVDVNEATEAKLNQETKTEESVTDIKTLEKNVGNELGVPIGSPEFIFYWRLWKSGELPQFLDEVVTSKTSSESEGLNRFITKGERGFSSIVRSLGEKYDKFDNNYRIWLAKQLNSIRKGTINPIMNDLRYMFGNFRLP